MARGRKDPEAERQQRRERIYAIVDSVPEGCVATYGQVASEAGLGRGARQVGRALRELPAGSKLAWHRIVNASGRISERGDGSSERLQRRRLRAEGVTFERGGRIDLERYRWRPDW